MAEASLAHRKLGRRPAAPARKLGNWKLAYADFLTALCAFFLLMWIINGVSAEEKAELAEQFRDAAQEQALELAYLDADPALQIAAQLQADPELSQYAASVSITAEPGLVRIDLTDHAARPLFELGEGRLNQTGELLTRLAGAAIAPLPFPMQIEGHTDSAPNLTPFYSNWELSADRANSARRLLLDSGVAEPRIRAVLGLAATRPLLEHTPHLPANRRISIVLLIDGNRE